MSNSGTREVVGVAGNACQHAPEISTCMSIKMTCQHTKKYMSTCTRNFNMHVKKINMHVNKNYMSTSKKYMSTCILFPNMHVEEETHVNMRPLFLMLPPPTAGL